MSKKTTKTTSLAGKVVKLLPSLQSDDGQPHPYAGQEVTIAGAIKRAGAASYLATTADLSEITIKPDDWGPTDAEMQKVISGENATAAPILADQLATIALYTDPTLNVVVNVDLDLIDDSPFQSRTSYPEDHIQGLAASMKVTGMLQAMLLRPKADGRYENVFGHCRKRGGKLAGLKQGPSIIRDLTDAECAQLLAIENLQRKPLDAFDEARSFADYIRTHNCTKDEFCRRTGLSRTLVYNRLKLSDLSPAGCDALRKGLIKSEVATMIARVPGEKQQAYALKIILDNSMKEPDEPDEVMTVRRARAFLREKFTLDLKNAIWDKDDETLLPPDRAVACTVCPKRSGVDQVVYEDLLGKQHAWSRTPGGENVCTDPACFDAKKTAQLKRNQAALEARGKTVIAGNKARQIISAEGNVKNGYIALKDVKAELTRIKTKNPEAVIEVATAQNPRNAKTIEVVKISELQAAGAKIATPAATSAQQSAQERAKRDKAEADMHLENATHLEAFRQVREALKGTARSTFDMQLIAARLWDGLDWDMQELLAKEFYQCDPKVLDKRIGSMGSEELAMLIMDCTLSENLEKNYHWSKDTPEPLIAACKHYSIDLKSIRKAEAAKPKAKSKDADAEQEEGEEAEA